MKITSIIPIETDSFLALNIVPPVTGELLLIEYSTVCAEERCTLVALASIVAHMVSLTPSLHICVHTRNGRDIVATELCVRHLVVNGIIHTRYTGYFIQILFILGPFMMFRLRWIIQMSELLHSCKRKTKVSNVFYCISCQPVSHTDSNVPPRGTHIISK